MVMVVMEGRNASTLERAHPDLRAINFLVHGPSPVATAIGEELYVHVLIIPLFPYSFMQLSDRTDHVYTPIPTAIQGNLYLQLGLHGRLAQNNNKGKQRRRGKEEIQKLKKRDLGQSQSRICSWGSMQR